MTASNSDPFIYVLVLWLFFMQSCMTCPAITRVEGGVKQLEERVQRLERRR